MAEVMDLRSGPPRVDNSITSIQYHSYTPYTSSFNYNDEIRIGIQNQDLYVLPHESNIYIEVSMESTATDAATVHNVSFVNNFIGHLFDEIRYEINGFEVDRCKNVGISSIMKGLCSYTKSETKGLQSASWEWTDRTVAPGHFNVCVPLKTLLGFCEDYKKAVINVKHELILVRARSDINCFKGQDDTIKIIINKVQWRIPHIRVDDHMRLTLLKLIEKRQFISMPYRSWDLYEYPNLPQTNKHVWTVKSADKLNKPRYIIMGFQTNRKNIIAANASEFDRCNISDVKVHLNSECYPYENMNIDFTRNNIAHLFQMYCKFQESYYHDQSKNPAFPYYTLVQFSESPLFVFDCSRQEDSLKHSTVDVRIQIEARANIPANTAAYCLIIHDNIVNYNPYTSIVHRTI